MEITTRVISEPLRMELEKGKKMPFIRGETHGCFTITDFAFSPTHFYIDVSKRSGFYVCTLQRVDRPLNNTYSKVIVYLDLDSPTRQYFQACFENKDAIQLSNPYYYAHTAKQ